MRCIVAKGLYSYYHVEFGCIWLAASSLLGVNDAKEIMSLNPNGAPPGYCYQAGATAYLIDPAAIYSVGGATEPAGTCSAPGASEPTPAAAGTYIPITGATSSAAIVDLAGTYSLASASAPTTDAAGANSGAGAGAPKLAPAGRYIPVTGATSSAAEVFDPAGTYSAAGASAPTTDPAGRYSELGASFPTAAAGAYIPIPRATSLAAEIVDLAGAHSLAEASAPTTDPAGRHSAAGASATAGADIPVTGATSAAAKIVSPPGTYLPPGATAPLADPAGTYSAAGASAPTTDPAGTYSSSSALTRLFIVATQITPANSVQSFHSVTAVANYYGATSREDSLAKEFFADYAGTSATMLFTRIGLGQRPHLLGANISNLTLTQLQSINGSLGLTFDGYTYSGNINLSGVASFLDAGHAIQTALNSDLQVAAVTAGSSIAPESASFTGYTVRNQLYVTSVSSGSIEIGGIVSGHGLMSGAQIIQQVSGTPGGVGEYSFFVEEGTVSKPEPMTETYGVLTVGAVNSGTVALGEEVTGAGLVPKTAIEVNLSGSGPGSTWIVDNAPAQTVTGDITMTAPPITVSLDGGHPIENNDFFDVDPNGFFGFDQNPSALSYVSGTAAAALGLTQASGAVDSSPGGQHPTTAQFMTSIVQSETSQFGSFQSDEPRLNQALAAWAQSTYGYQFLTANLTTSQAGSSAPTTDPAGTFSPADASAPTPAAPGTYIPVTGATSAAAEIVDPAGFYSLAGASAPTRAKPGYYVPTEGASYETPVSPGYYQPHAGATKELPALLPTISGTVAGQSTPSGQPDTPFSSVTINDPNIGTADSLSIQLTGGGGALADGAGFSGLTESPAGVYLLSGTADAITSELDALVFTPNTFSATSTFTLTDTTSLGTSANDANTTVAVTNGQPVVVSVSTFQADQSTLDQQNPDGYDILDSAANITASLNQLNDSHIHAITISDDGHVGASVQQLTTDATTIGKLQNANLSSALLAISDTAADVQAGLSTLVQDAGEIASIAASIGPVVVSAAAFPGDQPALDKIVGGFAISDTAADIMADLDQLNDSNISAITISDNGQISASVAQLTADATAIGDLRNANASSVMLAINDTAGDVLTGLSTLVADTGEIVSITASYGPIVVSAATFLADRSTLDKIMGGFDVSDTAANLLADLSTLNADPNVDAVTADIGAATLSGGVGVNAPDFSESGWATTLTVSEALPYAGAFSEGMGSTLSISSADTLSLTGTASLSGTTSGAGTLALGGGSTTIDAGASISVSNWSISGAGTDVTFDKSLNYAGSFSEGANDTFVLSGGNLLLSSTATFAGGTVDGSNFLYTEGTTTVSDLTIGGTVEWQNTNTVNQSGENVTLGDNISTDEAILYNTPKATYDILDNSGIGLGASTASYIHNGGLFEKTGGGMGASAIAPAVTNTGTLEVTSGTLDFMGAVTGEGTETISGASTLEFDAAVNSKTAVGNQNIGFTGGGTLDLTDPKAFWGEISDFAATDTVELLGSWAFSSFSENSGGTLATLTLASGATTHAFDFVGGYMQGDFKITSGATSTITYT